MATLAIFFSFIPVDALEVTQDIADSTVSSNILSGKTLSILGDSISTFSNYSNGSAAQTTNSTITNGAVYYPRSGFEVTVESTWWYQAAEELGLEILVNNSWSGSCLLNERSGTVGAYLDRCVQLHDDTGDNAGQKPDMIAIFLGTNDYYTYPSSLGSYEAIDFDKLIFAGDDGYIYSEPSTSLEAYAIILHKISQMYPDAQVYCLTLLPRVNSKNQPTDFNADVCQLAQHFGVYTVDLYDCGIRSDSESFYMLMGDSLHPDNPGMDAITNAFVSAVLKNGELTTHDISFALEDAVAMEGTTRTVVSGGAFETILAPLDASLPLEITVTMGGVDISESCCIGNSVKIPSVTADVVITAKPGQREPANFRWEMKDDAFVSVTTEDNQENPLTMTHGTITDGYFSKTRFTMSQGISLRHDLPWIVEWKSSGTWTDTTDGALLFSEANTSTSADAYYFFRRHKNDFFAFGSCTGGKYHNYGVKFAGTGIDTTAQHVFRLENRISLDGNNMIYLLVDNVEVGPMNHHYIGGTDQKETVDWVCGKDFTFSYMGTSPHTIGGCKLEYIQVWENGHTHTYENGSCTVCGDVAPYGGKVISIMGDSISTFAGYIPAADGYNREHLARYPQDNLLTDVNETWWMQVISAMGAKLGINESWRGSTLSGAVPVTSGDTGENAAMSNLIRIQNLGSNGTPDVIVLYGGTNDLAHVSKVGTFDPALAPVEVDLTTEKWDNLADGFVHTLLRMRHFYPDAMIVALLPTYTASYYSDEKLAQGNAVMAQICDHYGVPYVDLRDSGVTATHLPDGIHPGEMGMDLITDAVLGLLMEKCAMEPGENVVYPVRHELTHVKASLSHFKGVSAGKPFVETLSGENMTVSVTMDGVDITGQCYADGKITIAKVTGALVIRAEGIYSLKEHLQQLPNPHCGVNLWQVLEHDLQYYSAEGWTTHSSGQVKSITFPVSAGDRLYASSFGEAGMNGGTMNGIRVTYFTEDGVPVSMTAGQVYSEFTQNGCLTVPEGVIAVSIPMWTDSEDWDVHFLCVLEGYLQPPPEIACADTNLWSLMDHNPQYYTANGWGSHASGKVNSVTFRVCPGERLWATSFGEAGTNGGSVNGIRVTWFTQCGVLESVSADKVYREFQEYGFITVPEGVWAVNVPMWNDGEQNELHILNREHIPVSDPAVAATCTKTGLTEGSHCSGCGKVLEAQKVIPVVEHSYAGYVCIWCGTAQTSTFEILDTRNGQIETFTYELGMTWGAWLNSSYNTGMGSAIAIWVSEGPDMLGYNPYMDIFVNGSCVDYNDVICEQDHIQLIRYY